MSNIMPTKYTQLRSCSKKKLEGVVNTKLVCLKYKELSKTLSVTVKGGRTKQQGKGHAGPSSWPPTHINVTVATKALEEFQPYFLERRGEWNVPQQFVKDAVWFDLPDGDRYYYKDNKDWHLVEFNFEFLVWVDIWVKGKQYQVWQIAGISSLAITQEERSIPQSDWGPIDGAAEDPTSLEPENIDIWEPQSDHSDNESEKSEDVCIPLTDIEAREEESLQVFIHWLNTKGIPTLAPTIPRPPSQNTQLPSITVTLMVTTMQTTTHTLTIGCSSSGGGGGSGGGGVPSSRGGGGPPGGAANLRGGHAGGGAKLVGNPPQVYNGDCKKTQLFMSQWDIYWGLNYTIDIMAQPYTQVLCFLSYIQGEDIQDWVTHELCWLWNKVHANWVLPNNPWLWVQMIVHFKNAFIDTMTQARAQNELRKLQMEGGHINEYIAKFKWYVSTLGYNVDKPTVLDKFIKGLLISDVVRLSGTYLILLIRIRLYLCRLDYILSMFLLYLPFGIFLLSSFRTPYCSSLLYILLFQEQ